MSKLAPKSQKPIDFKSLQKWAEVAKDHSDVTSVAEYFRTRKTKYTVNGKPLLCCTCKNYYATKSDNHKDLIKGKTVCIYDRKNQILHMYQEVDPVPTDSFSCFEVGKRILFTINGDINSYDDGADTIDGLPIVSISYRCLSRMFGKNTIGAGKITIVDFLPDHAIYGKKNKPTSLGYTWVEWTQSWHRAGTVLFEYQRCSYLMGFDEGSYFCCQLPVKVKTIKDAFAALMPKEAKGYKNRQGEWYVVPVPSSKVPSLKDCIAFNVKDEMSTIALSVEHADSNIHRVTADEILVTKDGVYAINGELAHEEHASVEFNGWVRFVKNTAVRSVSVAGVD